MKKSITEKTFQEEVIEQNGLAVVQFEADWSGPCQMIAPIYEEISGNYHEAAKFFTVNADEETSLLTKYAIRDLPTIIFFKNGKAMDYLIGAFPKKVLITKVEHAIKSN